MKKEFGDTFITAIVLQSEQESQGATNTVTVGL